MTEKTETQYRLIVYTKWCKKCRNDDECPLSGFLARDIEPGTNIIPQAKDAGLNVASFTEKGLLLKTANCPDGSCEGEITLTMQLFP